jgi:hypothetical protein
MRASLVLQPLRTARWTLAALAAGLAALMLAATSTYEAFGGAQMLSQLLSRMPRAIRTIAGDENVLTTAGYFGTIFFHPLALTFEGGAAIALVTRLAQDVETHAADLLLSRPVTRVELALARYLAAFAGVGAVIACGALAFLAVSWAVGFAAVSYLVNFVGQLWKPMEPARRASVFYYFRPGTALAGSPPPAGYLALLAFVAVAGVLLGLLAFRRRDIAG